MDAADKMVKSQDTKNVLFRAELRHTFHSVSSLSYKKLSFFPTYSSSPTSYF